MVAVSVFFVHFYLTTFQVLIGNQVSSPYPVKSGVPQGSVLSPLLHVVLLCDIPHFHGVSLLS